jgi:PTH1 family peptidyl-tRNA hydrolase
MVVDVLAARWKAPRGCDEGDAWVARAELDGVELLLVKPLTFMNRSGIAVSEVLARHEGTPSQVIVIEDDFALELGTLRVRERGGHGGHNGLRSVIDVLGSDEIPRVRVGIGKGELPADLASYVLSDFPEEDVLIVQESVGSAADAVECLIREGAAAAMDRYNGPRKV